MAYEAINGSTDSASSGCGSGFSFGLAGSVIERLVLGGYVSIQWLIGELRVPFAIAIARL